MIKAILALGFIMTALNAQAFPDTPPDACYTGCTSKMKEILDNFDHATTPSLEPAVYSGECYHLSSMYDPNHTHYGVMMFDKEDQNAKPFFAMIFAFFYQSDEFAKWDVPTARTQMAPEWKSFGRNIIVASETARVEYINKDGSPGMLYWMRQNPTDKTIYQITYWSGSTVISFCEYKAHSKN